MQRIRFEWGKQNTARLIKLLKEQEVLWDRKHVNYNHKIARETAYSAILNDLQDVLPDDATIQDLRSKINCIRSAHSKARANCHKPYFNKPWYYDMMYYLRGEPKPETKRTGSNSRDHIDKLYEVDSNDEKNSKWKKEAVVLKLLQLYKEHPILWNPNHEHYRNRVKREHTHKRIAQLLSISDITARDVYKKLWSLRQTYRNLLKRNKIDDYEVPFWFDSMHFLQDLNSDDVSVKSTQMNVADDGNCSEAEVNEYNLEEDGCDAMDTSVVAINNTEENSQKVPAHAIYVRERKAETFENVMLEPEDPVEIPKTSNGKHVVKPSSAQIHKNYLPTPVTKGQVVDINKLAEKKFDWLIHEMIRTINRLHDEETIYDLINYMQKLLKEAASSDKMDFRPKEVLKEFQERKTLVTEQSETAPWDPLNKKSGDDVFEVKLTFKAKDDAQHIFAAISQLPNLEHIQLTGRNFHTALSVPTKNH